MQYSFRQQILLLVFLFLLNGSFPIYGQNPFFGVRVANAKLRQCPNTNCGIIRAVDKGEIGEILGLSKEEQLEGYGLNPWIHVQLGDQQGYIYGGLIEIIPVDQDIVQLDSTAYIKADRVNARYCAGLHCGVLFQLEAGTYCKVLSRTSNKESIGELGNDYWYLVESNGRKAFVFGGLLEFTEGILTVDGPDIFIYDQPNGKVIGKLPPDSYQILKQSPKSEVRRPYGRNYWYLIDRKVRGPAWVYGGVTSMKSAPVDCQCVDYIKNTLGITGPTKNAFEWDQVLRGLIPVTVNGGLDQLNYKEIPKNKIKIGDLAVFSPAHPEVDHLYGHIGYVAGSRRKPGGGFEILIEGGNHPVADKEFYTVYQCNNVSKKWYSLTNAIRFFRP